MSSRRCAIKRTREPFWTALAMMKAAIVVFPDPVGATMMRRRTPAARRFLTSRTVFS
jgi:hypothetical protein